MPPKQSNEVAVLRRSLQKAKHEFKVALAQTSRSPVVAPEIKRTVTAYRKALRRCRTRIVGSVRDELY